VAVEDILLFSGGVGGEVYGYAHRLAGPDEDRILPPAIHRQACCLLGTVQPVDDLELEAVDVHRVRHAHHLVHDLPDFYRFAFNGNRNVIFNQLCTLLGEYSALFGVIVDLQNKN